MQVAIVGRGNTGGFMEREQDETKGSYTKKEIEQRICESMGGRAAERIVKQQLDRAIEILKENRQSLDRLSEELLETGYFI